VWVLLVEPQRIQLEIENVFIDSALGGEFNVMNILAAAAAAMAFDVSLTAIAQALRDFGPVPGRLEYVQHEPFAVVVDYANTPAAYERVYAALIGENSKFEIRNPKLICVFGSAGGGRDKWKRPELGKIASRYCREVILTSDDPDDEDSAAIAREIRQGMVSNKNAIAKIVLDRREAIREGLKSARSGDTVIITGMGAQPWLIVKGKKIPWDDREIVREELSRIEHRNL
jgi:UDP-N-acetylmuramoyl-L-alanyl-D-glutamate--2,6-diaminopimelate ligase